MINNLNLVLLTLHIDRSTETYVCESDPSLRLILLYIIISPYVFHTVIPYYISHMLITEQ